jgi:hypothetical protein
MSKVNIFHQALASLFKLPNLTQISMCHLPYLTAYVLLYHCEHQDAVPLDRSHLAQSQQRFHQNTCAVQN